MLLGAGKRIDVGKAVAAHVVADAGHAVGDDTQRAAGVLLTHALDERIERRQRAVHDILDGFLAAGFARRLIADSISIPDELTVAPGIGDRRFGGKQAADDGVDGVGPANYRDTNKLHDANDSANIIFMCNAVDDVQVGESFADDADWARIDGSGQTFAAREIGIRRRTKGHGLGTSGQGTQGVSPLQRSVQAHQAQNARNSVCGTGEVEVRRAVQIRQVVGYPKAGCDYRQRLPALNGLDQGQRIQQGAAVLADGICQGSSTTLRVIDYRATKLGLGQDAKPFFLHPC